MTSALSFLGDVTGVHDAPLRASRFGNGRFCAKLEVSGRVPPVSDVHSSVSRLGAFSDHAWRLVSFALVAAVFSLAGFERPAHAARSQSALKAKALRARGDMAAYKQVEPRCRAALESERAARRDARRRTKPERLRNPSRPLRPATDAASSIEHRYTGAVVGSDLSALAELAHRLPSVATVLKSFPGSDERVLR